jgi:hypothetical protein
MPARFPSLEAHLPGEASHRIDSTICPAMADFGVSVVGLLPTRATNLFLLEHHTSRCVGYNG